MFKSFQALKELQENGEYDKPVKLPGYLNAVDGRFAIYLLRRKAPTSRKAWDERSES